MQPDNGQAARTARQLVQHINAHDVEALAALLSEEHRFVDSLGVVVCGRDSLREGWRQYFRLVPDYRLEVQQLLCVGPDVVLLGAACGTYSSDGTLQAQNAWRTPAAFHAQIRAGRVALWQVYADNEPIRRCMRAAAAGERHV
jgi:ketosteroid isomerase-like protein